MKALEKDRTRRYETANAFAADVMRYLNDEPVEASPPSTAYRLRKFAQKTPQAGDRRGGRHGRACFWELPATTWGLFRAGTPSKRRLSRNERRSTLSTK